MLKLTLAIMLPKHVQKQKGSLEKMMALHVRHDFWYISFISKVKVVRIMLSGLCESQAFVTNSWPGSFD